MNLESPGEPMNGAMKLPPITADLNEAKRHLAEYGLARVADALSPAELREALARLAEQADAEVAAKRSYHDGAAHGGPDVRGPNQRVWNLINKGDIFRRIAVSGRMLELVRYVLGPDILLSSMTANIARMGGKAMAIHTDQNYVPTETPYPLVCDVAWMLVDFKEENGATRVIPGSHLWGRIPRPGEALATVPATGPAGTALIFDGRLWHGTGASVADASRYALFTYYCRAFVRQQENFSLSTSPDVLAHAAPELLALLGFQVWNTLGMIEGTLHGSISRRPSEFSRELRAGAV